MPKIVEIKPEPKEESNVDEEESEEKTEEDVDEELKKSEDDLLAIADSNDEGWESVIDSNASPTLDRRVIRQTGDFSLRTNLESSLEDVPTENNDEEKKPEVYKLSDNSYMGKGGVLGEMGETRRVEEFSHDGPVKTLNQWKSEFEDTNTPKAYEVKRKVEDTIRDASGVAFQKYSPKR
jgi:hypothetical protein